MKHRYICECNDRRCERRLDLKVSEYEALSRVGMVMTAECARRENRPVLSRYNGYRIVVAANRGKALSVGGTHG